MEKNINLFSDKASLLLRALLTAPEGKRTVPSFVREGLSLGMASMAANQAEAAGYIEHVRRVSGESYCRLLRPELLLKDWTSVYSFQNNRRVTYVAREPKILKTLGEFLGKKGVRHALTLFSASRLISPYVKDGRDFAYVNVHPQRAASLLREMEGSLGLVRAKHGWNLCLASPLYKSSVFRDARLVRGRPVVSNLQLYLDLMGFPPLGRQELEENLLPLWREKGVPFV